LGPPETYVQNLTGEDAFGQLMYYDNTPLDNRIISFQSADIYTNGSAGQPEMFEIHRYLPRYIMLSIDDHGQITPSMPPVNDVSPWHDNVEGEDYPTNGALVWVTGGNERDDFQLDPIDNSNAALVRIDLLNDPYAFYDPYAVYTDTISCLENLATIQQSIACSNPENWSPGDLPAGRSSNHWLTDQQYGLVIYSLGYVRGKAQKLVRVVFNEP